jgi:hypothetical protein
MHKVACMCLLTKCRIEKIHHHFKACAPFRLKLQHTWQLHSHTSATAAVYEYFEYFVPDHLAFLALVRSSTEVRAAFSRNRVC